jgi:ATP-dependent Clp protease protease subunit
MNMSKRLLQLLADNRSVKAGRRFEVQAADEEATVYLYDVIVSSAVEAEFWGGVAAEQFVRDFTAITAPTIHLRINSPGGDVFAARAMETAIRSSKSKVVCHIDGYAASAASFLALAGDEVEISDGGFLMIHKSWSLAMGNADDMRETADLLDKVDATLCATYAKKTGMKCEEIMSLLSEETWLSAEECVDMGFCDRIAEAPAKAEALTEWNVSALRVEKPAQPEPDAALIESRASSERRMKHLERIAA